MARSIATIATIGQLPIVCDPLWVGGCKPQGASACLSSRWLRIRRIKTGCIIDRAFNSALRPNFAFYRLKQRQLDLVTFSVSQQESKQA